MNKWVIWDSGQLRQKELDFLYWHHISLGTVSRFSIKAASKQSVLEFNITVNIIRTFPFRHPENRERSSERKLAKILTIWLWWLFAAGPGGEGCCSPNLLDSSDFWEVEIWKLKIFHERGGIQGQFWNILTRFFFEPVPSVILTTPTHITPGHDTTSTFYRVSQKTPSWFEKSWTSQNETRTQLFRKFFFWWAQFFPIQSAGGVFWTPCKIEVLESTATFSTHPSGLGLVLEGLLGVLGRGLHVVHRMLHMILYPVNHLTLKESWVRQKSW